VSGSVVRFHGTFFSNNACLSKSQSVHHYNRITVLLCFSTRAKRCPMTRKTKDESCSARVLSTTTTLKPRTLNGGIEGSVDGIIHRFALERITPSHRSSRKIDITPLLSFNSELIRQKCHFYYNKILYFSLLGTWLRTTLPS
jgi:hypothetical protein